MKKSNLKTNWSKLCKKWMSCSKSIVIYKSKRLNWLMKLNNWNIRIKETKRGSYPKRNSWIHLKKRASSNQLSSISHLRYQGQPMISLSSWRLRILSSKMTCSGWPTRRRVIKCSRRKQSGIWKSTPISWRWWSRNWSRRRNWKIKRHRNAWIYKTVWINSWLKCHNFKIRWRKQAQTNQRNRICSNRKSLNKWKHQCLKRLPKDSICNSKISPKQG